MFGAAMIPIQVRVTKRIAEELDKLVQQGIHANRSEVVRDALRRYIENRAM